MGGRMRGERGGRGGRGGGRMDDSHARRGGGRGEEWRNEEEIDGGDGRSEIKGKSYGGRMNEGEMDGGRMAEGKMNEGKMDGAMMVEGGRLGGDRGQQAAPRSPKRLMSGKKNAARRHKMGGWGCGGFCAGWCGDFRDGFMVAEFLWWWNFCGCVFFLWFW